MVASPPSRDRKSTRLNSSHVKISYAVFCLKKKNKGLDVGVVAEKKALGQLDGVALDCVDVVAAGVEAVAGRALSVLVCFFFTDPPPTEIYTLSLHDALPICHGVGGASPPAHCSSATRYRSANATSHRRSEEHTSELQSRENIVCRLLLE